MTSYASNADNEITQVGSATYTYDANGNLATVTDASGTTTYTYNDLNQLVSITNPDGSVQSFQYSPLGFMVGTSTTTGGTTSQTNYLVDPTGLGNVVAAYNGSGSLIANYVYGLGLVSQTGPSGTGYYDFDASGNTIGITGSSGTYVNQYSYLPFGETTTTSAALPNPFTFVGQFGVMSAGNGMFDMRFRNYDVNVGQFMSNDPLQAAAGDSNFRRYALNDPISLVDPSGLQGTSGESSSGSSPPLYVPGTPGYEEHEFDYPAYVGDTRTPSQREYDSYQGQIDDLRFSGFGGLPAWMLLSWIRKVKFPDGRPPSPPPPPPPDLPPYLFLLPPFSYFLIFVPNDPNALIGPAGFGTLGYIQPTGSLPYTIDFENDGAVSAQDVTVTEQLSPNLNWSTFQLGSFGFGPINVTVPPGLTDYETTVAYQNTDGSSLNVLVAADFNVQTGLLSVTFTSLDPLTGQAPSGVFDGFLYPESTSAVDSDGYVEYTIQPQANLSTGTTISQQASVVFDINAPITTSTVVNTIDATPPSSTVAALPATTTSSSFTVSWSGSDGAGPGIASYNVYVSDNGGAFTPFLTDTTATSATFSGQFGNSYAFYSVATDNLGLIQPTPSGAQATTYLAAPPTSSMNSLPATTTAQSFTVSWSGFPGQGAKSIASYEIFVSDDGGPYSPFLTSITETSATFTGVFGNTYGFYSVATDNFGTVQPAPSAAQATTYLAAPPVSSVKPLPATTTSTTFTVSWSGSPGRGAKSIASYEIFVSKDGGPYTPFLTSTTETSATFAGVFGNTYAFYSVATDNFGTVQPAATSAQATTKIVLPPPVTVKKVVDDTNSKHQVTEILVTFSGAVNATEADNTATYRLATPGKGGSYTAKNAAVIKLKAAVYTGAEDTVTLTPAKPFALTKQVQLLVYGTGPTGLKDTYGRLIDGDDNGVAGSNATAILSKAGATIDALALSRPSGPADRLAAVDAAIEHESLAVRLKNSTARNLRKSSAER